MSTKVAIKSFRKAVEATPDISKEFNQGIQALGSYSELVIPAYTRYLEGSVDIDSATKSIYPTEPRWDYAIAYSGEVYFIEVHPAISSEVAIVIKKLEWLKNWLKNKAPEIEKLRKKENAYYWIQSKSFSIPKNSRQYRIAKKNGLLPIGKLRLV